MATSVATLKYGSYVFNPIPQIGIRSTLARTGESRTGPGTRERVVTLSGKLKGNNLNQVQTKVAALEAAFALDRQALYWHDGVTVRVNNVTSFPLSVEIPAEWGQYEAHYTITLFYYPLDDG